MNRSPTRQAGLALLDALLAMALLTFAAVATASLVHGSIRTAAEAGRLDRAREAAETALARLADVPWHALPGRFGAGGGDTAAALDTGDGTAPADWPALVADLPEGRLAARLEGLGPGGAAAPFDDALALRLDVEASYRLGAGAQRDVRLVRVRF